MADYRARFEEGRQEWREHLETMVFERLERPHGYRGSDCLALRA